MSKTKKKAKVEPLDELAQPLGLLLKMYMQRAGTDISGAIRDTLTELMHLCDQVNVNFEDRLQGAQEVYEEECEEAAQAQIELLVVLKPDERESDHVKELAGMVGTEAMSVNELRGGVDVLFHVGSKGAAQKLATAIRKRRFVKQVVVGEPNQER